MITLNSRVILDDPRITADHDKEQQDHAAAEGKPGDFPKRNPPGAKAEQENTGYGSLQRAIRYHKGNRKKEKRDQRFHNVLFGIQDIM